MRIIKISIYYIVVTYYYILRNNLCKLLFLGMLQRRSTVNVGSKNRFPYIHYYI